MGKKIEEVVNLFDQGMEPSLKLTREEAMEKGWIHEDTEKTRLIQLRGELIEIDYRMMPSKDGKKVVWLPGYHPNARKGFKKVHENIKKGIHPRRGTTNKGRSISSVLKSFMNAPPTKREFEKLPDRVKKNLEEYMGRGLTRADIAGFVLMGKAMDGDIMAFKEIADRTEGKAIQRTENKHVHGNYTDFLKGLAGFEEDEDDGEPYIDV